MQTFLCRRRQAGGRPISAARPMPRTALLDSIEENFFLKSALASRPELIC
jgi:hypothetical protein